MLSRLAWLYLVAAADAQVTVYKQTVLGMPTTSSLAPGATATYSGPAAFDPSALNPPAPPSPMPPLRFSLQLQDSPNLVQGLSIPQSGSFLGFSIETSVATQVLGINSSFIQVPFLNLMSLITARAGRVNIRVGGNTQETSFFVPSLADGKMIEKNKTDSTNPTQTPALLYTPELFNLLGNISKLVNAHWYLGIPFFNPNDLSLEIAEKGQAALGNHLLGLQVGNEPDLYVTHKHRTGPYTPADYSAEFGVLVNAVNNDSSIPVKNMLIGPNIAGGSGNWAPEDVWNTGFVGDHQNSLGALAVEHYPDQNCGRYNITPYQNPQDVLPEYLNHTAATALVQPYLNSTRIAQAAGKPFLMFETNTASCGGFPGVSNAFASTLWALDYALQMAAGNFSGANVHVGGVNVYYNPFTAPPTNLSTTHQWTVGPIFYASLVVAEAFGSSNASQIRDIGANYGNIYTPAYEIYEGGAAARVALFNYLDDPTGASAISVAISVGGGQTGSPASVPASVQVKYLVAPSVTERTNITWAGQTFGGLFASDGRLMGDLDVVTIPCDQVANTCTVTVPAPGFALVFLTSAASTESSPAAQTTFATTAVTKKYGTATVNPSVLATSNGHSGDSREEHGSTSKGQLAGGSLRSMVVPGMLIFGALSCISVVLAHWM